MVLPHETEIVPDSCGNGSDRSHVCRWSCAGARQVGKTWLVRDLATREKHVLLEVNFERVPRMPSSIEEVFSQLHGTHRRPVAFALDSFERWAAHQVIDKPGSPSGQTRVVGLGHHNERFASRLRPGHPEGITGWSLSGWFRGRSRTR